MTTQLTYDLRTSPDPLQVRGGKATMTLIASAQRSGLTDIQSITVTIPLGSGSQSLAETGSPISAQGPQGWTLDTSGHNGVFVFRPPASGDNGLSGGLVFAFGDITVKRVRRHRRRHGRGKRTAGRAAQFPCQQISGGVHP